MMTSANELPIVDPIDEDDLKEICDKCHGRRIIPSEKVVLKKPCNACGGDGKRYWVDKIMRNFSPSDKDIFYNCTQENIQFLIQLMREEAQKVGCDVEVAIKVISYHSGFAGHVHTNPMRIHMDEMYKINGGKW